MGIGATTEALIIHQPEKMSIPPRKIEIFRLHRLSLGIQIEEEQIKAVCDWPKPQSVRDIQVFLGFANFYQRFIQKFSRLTTPVTSMLKTASVANPAVGDEQDGKGIQIENQDEKE